MAVGATRRDIVRLVLQDGLNLVLFGLAADAKRRAYEAVAVIQFRDAFYRSDIADKALVAEGKEDD